MFSKLLKAIGLIKLIKLNVRHSFGDLTSNELSMMIDAFLNNDGSNFDVFAIYEFRLMHFKNDLTEYVRKEIISIEKENRTTNHPDGLNTEDGRQALRKLSEKLRSKIVQER